MDKIRRILLPIVCAVALLVAMCSCETEQSVVQSYDDTNTYIVDVQYDKYDNVISKSVYNKVTAHTYLYTYEYEYCNGFWVCSNTQVVAMSKSGGVIYPEDANG